MHLGLVFLSHLEFPITAGIFLCCHSLSPSPGSDILRSQEPTALAGALPAVTLGGGLGSLNAPTEKTKNTNHVITGFERKLLYMYIYIYIYIYMYVHIEYIQNIFAHIYKYMYIYIYMYREREREKEIE